MNNYIIPTNEYETINNVIKEKISTVSDVSGEKYKSIINSAVATVLSGKGYGIKSKHSVAEYIYAKNRGFDILQPLMDDNNVTDILVNAPDKIFYESKGKLLRYDKNFDGTEHLMNFIRRIFDDGGKGINEKHPIEDIGLNDGSRANAILPPIAEGSPILCIRKFTGIKPDLNALIDTGFIKKTHADYLSESIINKKNIFIAGGTGTGKTTFLNVLSSLIPSDERIIIIEDSPELNFAKSENQVRLLTRRAFADGSGGVTMSDLIRTALRMRPDRIIVGEVRGSEASDMLWAMNTGHRGSLSTGHGNSALNMITRLGNMIRIERDVPQDIINSQIAGSLNIIVHLEKLATGTRKVNEIIEIKGYVKGDFVYETIE